jgi:hypothetical protein
MFQDLSMTITQPHHYHPFFPRDAFEHPRDQPLDICPAQRCRQRKRCCSAYLGKYCRRVCLTHKEMQIALAAKLERLHAQFEAEDRANGVASVEPHDANRGLAELKRALQERETEAFQQVDDDWKAGRLDAKFGLYSAKGFYRPPPPLTYVEVIRDEAGKIIREKAEAEFHTPSARKKTGLCAPGRS